MSSFHTCALSLPEVGYARTHNSLMLQLNIPLILQCTEFKVSFIFVYVLTYTMGMTKWRLYDNIAFIRFAAKLETHDGRFSSISPRSTFVLALIKNEKGNNSLLVCPTELGTHY